MKQICFNVLGSACLIIVILVSICEDWHDPHYELLYSNVGSTGLEDISEKPGYVFKLKITLLNFFFF